MTDLLAALSRAIGEAALAKHLESCDLCGDDHSCAVAKAHRRTLSYLRTTPEGSDR